MVAKTDSKLSSKHDVPQIGEPQTFVADVATTGTYATDDDAIVAAINDIKDCLVYHGLMNAS